jgi:hypothetical protein
MDACHAGDRTGHKRGGRKKVEQTRYIARLEQPEGNMDENK